MTKLVMMLAGAASAACWYIGLDQSAAFYAGVALSFAANEAGKIIGRGR